MACATLKRSYEFDPTFGFPYESFAKRLKLSEDELDTYHNYRVSSKMYHRSAFREITVTQKNQLYKNSKINHERIAARKEASESPLFVQDHPCKKFKFNFEGPKTGQTSPHLAFSFSAFSVKTPRIPSKTRVSIPTKGPLLSTSAAGYVCDMIVDEHEKMLREHYENVLNSKLASQLEGYVKHNLEILRTRYASSSFSYAS